MRFIILFLLLHFSNNCFSSEHKKQKYMTDQESIREDILLKNMLERITYDELNEIVYLSDDEFQDHIMSKIAITERLITYFMEALLPYSVFKKEYKEFELLFKYITEWMERNKNLDVFTLRKKEILNELLAITAQMCELLEQEMTNMQAM